MKCTFCTYDKFKWLWLAIECELRPVCYDCALTRELYCPKHQIITFDLDDGTLCPYCVDNLIKPEDTTIARITYRRVSKYLSKEKIAKLVEWVALACNDEPLPRYWSLWWAIVAKAYRTEDSIEEVVIKIVHSKDLGILVPFSDTIKSRDIAQLNPPIWVAMVHKKGLPVCYIEALWRRAVAQAKRDSVSFAVFLERLSASLPHEPEPSKKIIMQINNAQF